MTADRIEHEILINAPVAKVWEVLTDPDQVAVWFGPRRPLRFELRPGGALVFDHGEHGELPARIQDVQPQSLLSFRWTAHGTPGVEPTESDSTLVEFRLIPQGPDTILKVTESGFAELPDDLREGRFRTNAAGWGRILQGLKQHVAP